MMRYIIVFLFLIINAGVYGLRAQTTPQTDHLLKVQAAEAAGIDTLTTFKTSLENYRRGLIRAELTEEAVMEEGMHRYYERMKSNGRLKQIRVRQIYLPLLQNVPQRTLKQTETRMDSIYTILQRDTTAAGFAAVVDLFSAIKEAKNYRALQMPAEMEAIADTLKVGQHSRPFFTPLGLHILRLEDRQEALSYETVCNEVRQQLSRSYRTDKGTLQRIEQLKEELHFVADMPAVNELLAKGKSVRTLFTIAGKVYDGKQFARFSESYPYGVRRQWEAFVVKSLLDYADEHLPHTSPAFAQKLQSYRDSLLIAAITRKEIDEKYPLTDEALTAYFERHLEKYRWNQPRFRGIVLHAADKRIGKQIRKLLKELPEAEWQNALRLMINNGGKELVRSEQGVFQPGDNPHVDRKFFKKRGEAAVDVSYPFTYFLGKKVKEPKGFEEIREVVVRDYRRSLEKAWIEQLRRESKVEIDQEVLKTVNVQ